MADLGMGATRFGGPDDARSAAFDMLLGAWSGESVHIAFEPALETWFFICVHSTQRGPAAGGIRMKHYPLPAAALQDGLRLSAAMTLKMAICDAPLGGGKSVIATPATVPAQLRYEILERFARLLASLKGTYMGGPDMNTSADDMDFLYERAPFVFCRSVAAGGSGSTAPGTARGVLHGILATARHVFGTEELARRRIIVQGVGGVGGHLARMLHERGAEVAVADVVTERVDTLVAELGVQGVPAEAALTAECDIFAPCALGGILNQQSIPRLRCRIVAGAANNQLETIEDDGRLRDAGVVYAPDFVINSGGVLHGVGFELWGWGQAEFETAAAGIGDTLTDIYRTAKQTGKGTHATAEAFAQARLASSQIIHHQTSPVKHGRHIDPGRTGDTHHDSS